MNHNSRIPENFFIPASAIFVLTFLTYYPSVIQVFFTQNTICPDDRKLIDGLINSPMKLEGIFASYGHYYRPFINFSFWLDQTIWGANAFSFRLTNLCIHSLNGVLLYAVCRTHFCSEEQMNRIISFLAALIFSLHPVAVESTSWISGRTDLFASFWSLLSIFLYFSGRKRKDKVRTGFGLLLLVPAILSKESAYATPLLFIFTEFTSRIKEPEKARASLKAIILPIAVCLIFYLNFKPEIISKAGSYLAIFKNLTPHAILSFFYISAGTMSFYLKKFLYPFPLTFYITDIFTGFYALTGTLFLPCAAIFLRSASRKNLVLTAWVILGLLPSIYVAVASPAWTRWAERYLYYSLAPLSVLFGSSVARIYRQLEKDRKKYALAAAFSICALFLPVTVKRSLQWNSNSLLWKNELVKNSHSATIYLNYGNSLFEEKRYKEAKHFYKLGLQYPGMSYLIYFNLGKIAKIESDFRGAEAYYMKAVKEAGRANELKLNRDNLTARIYSSIGHLFLQEGNFDAPEAEQDRALLLRAAENLLLSFKNDRSFIYDVRMAARVFIRTSEKRRAVNTLKLFVSQNPPDHYKKWALKKISALSDL